MTNTLRKTQPRRLMAAWLALLLALLGALAPTVSHALVFAQVGSNGLINGGEICTTQGPRVLALQGDAADPLADPAPRQDSARTLDHCPFCLNAADHAAPPVQHAPYRIRGLVADVLGVVDAAPSYLTPAYSHSSPRGPPARA